ncbi:hypothetical protein P5763_07250 [Bacillus cereus]|uniref:hypothetical protein n=1 Tax=Bacillus cereus TaxID=1396 RepID=UPI0024055AC6|nr:hypothetical protein [Bacillus cereus]MDF9611868.1 hypothetical protein [Bacillus cereus]
MTEIKPKSINTPTLFYRQVEFEGDGWAVKAEPNGDDVVLSILNREDFEFDEIALECSDRDLILSVEEAKELCDHLNKSISEAEYIKNSGRRTFREEA